jgi:hypothetical protein
MNYDIYRCIHGIQKYVMKNILNNNIDLVVIYEYFDNCKLIKLTNEMFAE